jgi:hypothetical protein
MSRTSYVDDSNCLIFVSNLPFVYRNNLVSRPSLVSVRQGMIPQCERGENIKDIEPLPLRDPIRGSQTANCGSKEILATVVRC